MIFQAKSRNFRSLRNFQVNFNPGLNVLIGPNGSGKTNIIDLLKFISDFANAGEYLAVSRAGGTGQVFSKEQKSKSKSMSFEIRGVLPIIDKPIGIYPGKRNELSKFIKYQHSAVIQFDADSSSIIAAKEKFILKYTNEGGAFSRLRSPDFKISVKRRIVDEGIDNKIELDFDEEDPLLSRHFFRNEKITKSEQIKEYIISNSGAPDILDSGGTTCSLLARAHYGFRFFRSDVTFSNIFNINPQAAKSVVDIARPPFVEADGDGVSALLGYIKTGNQLRRRYIDLHDKLTLSEITDYLKLVNKNITNIDVEDNHQRSERSGYIYYGEDNLKIPFSSVSDGTIKWLVLILILKVMKNVSAIEEPENYIHPSIQTALVNLCRETLEVENNSFLILSTHSETILNNCKPEEVILVEFSNGKSLASRPCDPEMINEEIQRTGFGLGYYYVTGALDG